jgi:hypothetical protein
VIKTPDPQVLTISPFDGADGNPEEGRNTISQWTTVVSHRHELVWLRKVLALNAAEDTGAEGDDLDPARLTPIGLRSRTPGRRENAVTTANGK